MKYTPWLVLGLVASVALACSSNDNLPALSSSRTCDSVELLVAANSTDYQSSVVCGVPGTCVSGADLGGDPMLSRSQGRAFFVARDKDLVIELDPGCATPLSSVSVNSLARTDGKAGRSIPANPHDVAAAPDGTLVVPLYNAARLAFLKGGKVDSWLELSDYDADGNPQAESARVLNVGGAAKAFVTLERLDDRDKLRSKQSSQMLRIDMASRSVEAVIELAGRNPFNAMVELGTALYLAEPGNFDAADEDLAGIERFDAETSTTKLLVRERELGGSVSEIALTEGCGAAIIAGPEANVNPTSVVTFDPSNGRVITSAAAPAYGPTEGYNLFGLAWRGRTLYVGDRRRGPGGYPVHVFERTDDCHLTDTKRTILLDRAPVALRPAEPAETR